MRATQSFQRLFKRTSKGKIVQWDIAVSDPSGDQSVGAIVTKWGEAGGKIQETTDLIKSGKNTGRANATTPYEQALAEAKSTWELKLKKGYVKSHADAQSGKEDKAIAGGRWVMLAHKYKERGDKIAFPCAVQPKLNGHRMHAHVKNRKAVLWSRKRNEILGVPHINRALEAFVPDNGEYWFDGEGYEHSMHDNLEQISHFLRSETPEAGHEIVQYHIYDFMNDDTFAERWQLVSGLFDEAETKGGPLVRVLTEIVEDEAELFEAFERFKKLKYEGAMARNLAGLYKSLPPPARSEDLQKLKPYLDENFLIVGVVEGRGKLMGHGLFKCVTDDGKEFEVKMRGPLPELKKFLEHPDQYIGKEVTVRFASWTKRGIPFHGVGWDFLTAL